MTFLPKTFFQKVVSLSIINRKEHSNCGISRLSTPDFGFQRASRIETITCVTHKLMTRLNWYYCGHLTVNCASESVINGVRVRPNAGAFRLPIITSLDRFQFRHLGSARRGNEENGWRRLRSRIREIREITLNSPGIARQRQPPPIPSELLKAGTFGLRSAVCFSQQQQQQQQRYKSPYRAVKPRRAVNVKFVKAGFTRRIPGGGHRRHTASSWGRGARKRDSLRRQHTGGFSHAKGIAPALCVHCWKIRVNVYLQ